MHKKTQSNTIRIIAGEWRGRRLQVLDREGLRPTTDRVRETVFNWLMPDIVGARCLDLFAGTGALGLESLSRGAAYVQFCEMDRAATVQLTKNVDSLVGPSAASVASMPDRADVICMDALKYLQNNEGQRFDIIFLDPPFDGLDILRKALEFIHRRKLLLEDGLVYIESNRFDDPFSSAGEETPTRDEASERSKLKIQERSKLVKSDLEQEKHQPIFAEYRSKVAGKARFGLYVYKG